MHLRMHVLTHVLCTHGLHSCMRILCCCATTCSTQAHCCVAACCACSYNVCMRMLRCTSCVVEQRYCVLYCKHACYAMRCTVLWRRSQMLTAEYSIILRQSAVHTYSTATYVLCSAFCIRCIQRSNVACCVLCICMRNDNNKITHAQILVLPVYGVRSLHWYCT